MKNSSGIANSSRAIAVAVTGGMGSGKSEVSQFLGKRLRWPLLNADLVCKTLLATEGAGWKAFIHSFGSGYLDEEGEVNRSLLRRQIFADADLRRKLENILHPLARKEIQLQMAQSKKAGENVLVEVPLLFEAGWQEDFDKVVVVYADEDVCLARICRRDGVSLDEARKGLAVQMPLKEKVMAADYIIDNSDNWSNTVSQLLHLSEILKDLACHGGKNT